MQIEVVKIGKPSYPQYEGLIAEYLKRLKPFCKIRSTVLKESEAKKRFSAQSAGPRSFVVMLDELGDRVTSKKFAETVTSWTDDPAINEVVIVIGPPYGFGGDLNLRADKKLALTDMTLTSDMAWLVVWEQLYRASQIIQGTGYHHE